MNAPDTAVRKKLHTFIDALPDYSLPAIEPLLSYLADEAPVIETDLTDEELLIIAEGDRRFKEHPEEFVPLESIR
jgi:hypothetical protein